MFITSIEPNTQPCSTTFVATGSMEPSHLTPSQTEYLKALLDPESLFTYKGIQNQCANLSFSFNLIQFLKELLDYFQQSRIEVVAISLHGGSVRQIVRDMHLDLNDLDIYIEILPPEMPCELQQRVFDAMEKIGNVPPKKGPLDPTVYFTVDGIPFTRPQSQLFHGGLKALGFFKDSLLFTFPCFVGKEPRDIDLMIAWGKKTICFSSADSFHIDLLPWIQNNAPCQLKTVNGYELDTSLCALRKGLFFLHSLEKARDIQQGLRIYVAYITKGLLPETPQIEMAFVETFDREYSDERSDLFIKDLERYIQRHFQKESFKTFLFLYNFRTILNASQQIETEKKEKFLLALDELFDRSIGCTPETRCFTLSLLFWRCAEQLTKNRLDDYPGESRYQIAWQSNCKPSGYLFVPLPLKETLDFLSLPLKVQKNIISELPPTLTKTELPSQEDKLIEWILKKIQDNLPEWPFAQLGYLLSLKETKKSSPILFIQKFLSLQNRLKVEELPCLTQLLARFYPQLSLPLHTGLEPLIKYIEGLPFQDAHSLWASLLAQDRSLYSRYQTWIFSSPLTEEKVSDFIQNDCKLEDIDLQNKFIHALEKSTPKEFKHFLNLALFSQQASLLERLLEVSLKNKDEGSAKSVLKKMAESSSLSVQSALKALKQLCQKINKDSEWLIHWEFLLNWSGKTDSFKEDSHRVACCKVLILDNLEHQKSFFSILLKIDVNSEGTSVLKWLEIAQFLGKKWEGTDLISFLSTHFPSLVAWTRAERLKLVSSDTFLRLNSFVHSLSTDELLLLSSKTKSLPLSDPLQSFLLDRFSDNTHKDCQKYHLDVCTREMPSESAVKYLLKIPAPWSTKISQLGQKAVEAHLLDVETLWNMSSKEDGAFLIKLADFCFTQKLPSSYIENDLRTKIATLSLPKDLTLLSTFWNLCQNFLDSETYALKIMDKVAILTESKERSQRIYSLYLHLSSENQVEKLDVWIKSVGCLLPEEIPPASHETLVSLFLSHKKTLASKPVEQIWPAIVFFWKLNTDKTALFEFTNEILSQLKTPILFSCLLELSVLLNRSFFYTAPTFQKLQINTLRMFYETKSYDKGLVVFEALASLFFNNTKSNFFTDREISAELIQLLNLSLIKPPKIPLSENCQRMISLLIEAFADSEASRSSLDHSSSDPNEFLIVKNQEGDLISSQELICHFFAALSAHKKTAKEVIYQWSWIGAKYQFFEGSQLIQIAKCLEISAKQRVSSEILPAIFLFQVQLIHSVERLQPKPDEKQPPSHHKRTDNVLDANLNHQITATIIHCHAFLLNIYSSLRSVHLPKALDNSGDVSVLLPHARWLEVSYQLKIGLEKINYVQYGCELFSSVKNLPLYNSPYTILLFQQLMSFCTVDALDQDYLLVQSLVEGLRDGDFTGTEREKILLQSLELLVPQDSEIRSPPHYWMHATILLEEAIKYKMIQTNTVSLLMAFLDKAQHFYLASYIAFLHTTAQRTIISYLYLTHFKLITSLERHIKLNSLSLSAEELKQIKHYFMQARSIINMLQQSLDPEVVHLTTLYQKHTTEKLEFYHRL